MLQLRLHLPCRCSDHEANRGAGVQADLRLRSQPRLREDRAVLTASRHQFRNLFLSSHQFLRRLLRPAAVWSLSSSAIVCSSPTQPAAPPFGGNPASCSPFTTDANGHDPAWNRLSLFGQCRARYGCAWSPGTQQKRLLGLLSSLSMRTGISGPSRMLLRHGQVRQRCSSLQKGSF